MKVTTWIVAAFAVGGLAFRQDPATDLEIMVTEGTNIAAAASPDRRSIAMDLQGGLWVLPIAGGEAKRITPETFEARQPTWSPDSQSIAFQGYDDNAWHIYTIRVDGSRLTAVTSGPFDACADPNGREADRRTGADETKAKPTGGRRSRESTNQGGRAPEGRA